MPRWLSDLDESGNRREPIDPSRAISFLGNAVGHLSAIVDLLKRYRPGDLTLAADERTPAAAPVAANEVHVDESLVTVLLEGTDVVARTRTEAAPIDHTGAGEFLEMVGAIRAAAAANDEGAVTEQQKPDAVQPGYSDALGDSVLTGRVLVSPGGMHTTVIRSGGRYLVRFRPGETVSGHCPSVNVLMRSVAQNVGANSIGAILTGMGSDGADGLRQTREAGARTLAQDEATCVVFGMPKEAFRSGGAERRDQGVRTRLVRGARPVE